MAVQPQTDITTILGDIRDGKDDAEHKLYDVVYDELHKVAAKLMKREKPGHILQTTALIHEAYFRLTPKTFKNATNRRYFYGAVMKAMRRILIEYSRKKPSAITLPDELAGPMRGNDGAVELLDVSLKELEKLNERLARVTELRFLGRLPIKEVADQLDVSVGTIEKDLRFIRAWLFDKLKRESK
ncbi:MAG: ECF-type sigma factor [Phycisphaerales bacterium]|nr:ECF-type sigma factor [Phycisphaerales bacterium]